MLYQNPTVLKNWSTFLKAIAQAESFMHLEQKLSFHASQPMYNREKPIKKAIKNSHSSNSHNNHSSITTHRNLQAHSQGCRD